MNTREKGNRNERKAVKELEDVGWLTYRVKGSTKFNKSVDIFGLWDIISIKQVSRITLIKVTQVKTNKKPTLKPFKEFKEKYPGLECELWIYKDRKEKEIVIVWNGRRN